MAILKCWISVMHWQVSPAALTGRYTLITPSLLLPLRLEQKKSSPSSSKPSSPAQLIHQAVGQETGRERERELKEDALVSNPVCRFRSSLIPSNRSQLSQALGQGVCLECSINLVGSKAGCQGKHLVMV